LPEFGGSDPNYLPTAWLGWCFVAGTARHVGAAATHPDHKQGRKLTSFYKYSTLNHGKGD
jgi:hypothetical protein